MGTPRFGPTVGGMDQFEIAVLFSKENLMFTGMCGNVCWIPL